MNTEEKPMYEWNTINWKKIQHNVFKLQKRIYFDVLNKKISTAQGRHGLLDIIGI